jgi:hypothetical protein
MKKVISIVFLFSVLFIFSGNLCASEKCLNESNNVINFSKLFQLQNNSGKTLKSDLSLFSDAEGTKDNSANLYLGMGIAGSVLLGLGAGATISGIVLFVYLMNVFGTANLSVYYLALNYILLLGLGDYLSINGVLLILAPILLSLGIVFLCAGLALTLVGFITYGYKKRAGMSYRLSDSKPEYSAAISIKI